MAGMNEASAAWATGGPVSNTTVGNTYGQYGNTLRAGESMAQATSPLMATRPPALAPSQAMAPASSPAVAPVRPTAPAKYLGVGQRPPAINTNIQPDNTARGRIASFANSSTPIPSQIGLLGGIY